MSDTEHLFNRDSDVRVRKRYSLVWKFFEKLSSSRVKCRVCQHEQKYLGNTANALRHLKVKHDVDARAIGLSDSANVKRMTAIMNDVDIKKEVILDYHLDDEKIVEGDRSGVQQKLSVNRSKSVSDPEEEEEEIDPYSDADHIIKELDNYGKTTESCHQPSSENKTQPFEKSQESSSSPRKRKDMNLMDQRLIAETEYFREKAGYYRIQKHLAAIQAKRAKYELEQLYAK